VDAWRRIVSDERGDLIAFLDLPTIGEGTQRRVDAANLADLIREHGPYAFAIVEKVGARPGQGVSSMFRFGQAYGRHRSASHPHPPCLAGEVEEGARPQQRRRNVAYSRDRDMAGTGRAFCA
jgi:hypothetical protein